MDIEKSINSCSPLSPSCIQKKNINRPIIQSKTLPIEFSKISLNNIIFSHSVNVCII